MAKLQVSAVEFVKLHNEASNIEQLLEKMALEDTKENRGKVRVKASTFRKQGVPLKYFEHAQRGQKVDWTEVAQAAKAALNGAPDPVPRTRAPAPDDKK